MKRKSGVSRRDFLKSSALAGAAVASGVLDRDYFQVSDADMRNTRPILTVVDGKVVHDTGAFN